MIGDFDHAKSDQLFDEYADGFEVIDEDELNDLLSDDDDDDLFDDAEEFEDEDEYEEDCERDFPDFEDLYDEESLDYEAD